MLWKQYWNVFVAGIFITYTITSNTVLRKVSVPEPAGKNLEDIYISLFKNKI